MIIEMLILGFVLSLDNFRVAIALGTVPMRIGRALQVAAVFGFLDFVMPLVGLMLGGMVSESTGEIAEYVGSAALGGYGLYLLIGALRRPEPEKLDHPLALFGIPLTLSVDNLFAGAGLGLLGFSPWLSAGVFGVITAVMSLIGLRLGSAAARLIRIRSDVLAGITLITAAIVLPLAFG